MPCLVASLGRRDTSDSVSSGKADSGVGPESAITFFCPEKIENETKLAILAEYMRLRSMIGANPHVRSGDSLTIESRKKPQCGGRTEQGRKEAEGMCLRSHSITAGMSRPFTRAERLAFRMDYGANRNEIRQTEMFAEIGAADTFAQSASHALEIDAADEHGENTESASFPGKCDGGIVIDGQNVACEYGGRKRAFRARGIMLCLDYYRLRGIDAIAVVPRRRVDGRMSAADPKLANELALLHRLGHERRCFFSPSDSHDDYFIIQFAMQYNRKIVSNDKFREVPALQELTENKRRVAEFIKASRIPFMFIRDLFLPAPNETQLGVL
jgi:Zc3h12a-like Ribonuclease NYN domain